MATARQVVVVVMRRGCPRALDVSKRVAGSLARDDRLSRGGKTCSPDLTGLD